MREVPLQIAARLSAAAELFADRGVEHTKIEEIAAATGVPKATLYYYFSGKEDILAFLFHDTLRHIADQVAIAVGTEGDARDRLVGVVRAQLEVMADQPAVCRALTGSSAGSDGCRRWPRRSARRTTLLWCSCCARAPSTGRSPRSPTSTLPR